MSGPTEASCNSAQLQLDRGGLIRKADDGVFQLLGYESEEVIGKSVFDLVHPDDRGRVRGYLQEHLAILGAAAAGIARLVNKEGLGILVEGSGIARRSSTGTIIVDVVLTRVQSDENRCNDPLARIARGVAHDLGNLLGFLKVQTLETPEPLEFTAVRSALESALGLARSLGSAASGEVSAPETELNEAVRLLLPALHAMTGDRLRLTAELSGQLLTVPMSRPAVHQVLLNLIVNAKEAAVGRASARIRTERFDGRAVLIVENTGSRSGRLRVGRVAPGPLPPAGGRGVGLVTLSNLVGHRGGTVDVERSDPALTRIVVAFGEV